MRKNILAAALSVLFAVAFVQAADTNVAGVWKTTVQETMMGDISCTLTIEDHDGTLGGTQHCQDLEPAKLESVELDGDKLSMSYETGFGPVMLAVTVTGDEMSGTWDFGGQASGPLTGKRQ
jgi:hypothetical protein